MDAALAPPQEVGGEERGEDGDGAAEHLVGRRARHREPEVHDARAGDVARRRQRERVLGEGLRLRPLRLAALAQVVVQQHAELAGEHRARLHERVVEFVRLGARRAGVQRAVRAARRHRLERHLVGNRAGAPRTARSKTALVGAQPLGGDEAAACDDAAPPAVRNIAALVSRRLSGAPAVRERHAISCERRSRRRCDQCSEARDGRYACAGLEGPASASSSRRASNEYLITRYRGLDVMRHTRTHGRPQDQTYKKRVGEGATAGRGSPEHGRGERSERSARRARRGSRLVPRLRRGHDGQHVRARRRRLGGRRLRGASSSSSSSPSGMSMRGGPTRGPVAVSGTGAAAASLPSCWWVIHDM